MWHDRDDDDEAEDEAEGSERPMAIDAFICRQRFADVIEEYDQ